MDYIGYDNHEFDRLIKFFEGASDKLKYPKFRMMLGHSKFVLLVRVAKGKFAGSIKVTDEDRNLYGYIGLNGRWLPGKGKYGNWICKNLKKLLENPTDSLREYSNTYGDCCFCNKPLTDDKSTRVGYGETCSKSWKIHKQWLGK